MRLLQVFTDLFKASPTARKVGTNESSLHRPREIYFLVMLLKSSQNILPNALYDK